MQKSTLSYFTLAFLTLFSACTSTDSSNAGTKNDSSAVLSQNQTENTAFFVESVFPSGEVQANVRFPSIQVQFSEPVVPLKKLGDPIKKSDVISISPNIKGTFRWYGTSLLSFDSEEALIPQKKYTVSVNPSLTSVNGTKISGTLSFYFQTEELALSGITPAYTTQKEKQLYLNPSDIASEYVSDIAVKFGNNVNAKVVSSYLTIRDSEKTYAFTAKQLERDSVLLTLKEKLPQNTQIFVELREGAIPDKNCVATTKVQNRSFHTLKPFVLNGVSGTSNLRISFNHLISENCLKSIQDSLVLQDSAKQKIEINSDKIKIMGNSIIVEDIPVTYGDEYSVFLAKSVVRDVYDQVFDQILEQNISVPDADQFAQFRDGRFVVLEGQFEPRRAVEFQNVLPESEFTLSSVRGISDNFKVDSQTFSLESGDSVKNRRVIQTVNLSPFLEPTAEGRRGAVKLESSAFYKNAFRPQSEKQNITSVSYIQVTDIGVIVHATQSKTAVSVTSLSTAKALSGATVSLYALQNNSSQEDSPIEEQMLFAKGRKLYSAKTDSEGLVVFPQILLNDEKPYLIAETPFDRLVLPLESWYFSLPKENNVTYIAGDRDLYRPGETAYFKIIDRTLKNTEYSSYAGAYKIELVSSNYWQKNRTVYKTENGVSSKNGTSSIQWEIPESIAPGNYFLEYSRQDGSGFVSRHSINVQYFERVRFQANAKVQDFVYTSGDSVSATVSASYLGGGALDGGSVEGIWTREASAFSPLGERNSGFTFGPLLNDWYWSTEKQNENFREVNTERIGTDGFVRLSVPSGNEKTQGAAYRYKLEARVVDAGNQLIVSSDSTFVHPADFYIGLGFPSDLKGFAKKGEKLNFPIILSTPQGEIPAATLLSKKKIHWELKRKDWEKIPYTDEYGYTQYKWEQKVSIEQDGDISTNVADAQKTMFVQLSPKFGGRYLLSLSTEDSKGRSVVTERTFYVSGSDFSPYSEEGDFVSLTADKDVYDSGDVAHILLNSSLASGRYLVTVDHGGIVSQSFLNLSENSSVIDIPIKEEYVPQISVYVSAYKGRSAEPPKDYDINDEGKPQVLYGATSIQVSKSSKNFKVDISLDKTSYLPGAEAKVDLYASKDGVALSGAELALMVVDRGALDVTGYRPQSMVDYFYNSGNFSSRHGTFDSVSALVDPVTYETYTTSARERQILYKYYMNSMDTLAFADEAEMDFAAAPMMSRAMVKEESMEENGSELKIRSDFRATAAFLPNLVTDENGKVSAKFTLPDSITEYAVIVLGVKEQNFAKAEASLVAANPVSVRDIEPKLLRPNDKAEVGIVLTNIGEESQPVTVSLSVVSGKIKSDGTFEAEKDGLNLKSGEAFVDGTYSRSVLLEKSSTRTLLFDLKAKSQGWITLKFRVESPVVNEIIYRSLEIDTPPVFETVTTLGEILPDEKNAQELLVIPSHTDFGSLTVQLDSSRLGSLSSAVNYVFHYPYGCMEQRSAAILPLIAFGDYINVFNLKSEIQDVKKVVNAEFLSWADVQKSDGGFPYWRDSSESSFAVSLRIAEILSLAKQNGYVLPQKINLKKLSEYLKVQAQKFENSERTAFPEAYAAYVLSLLGEPYNAEKLKTLLKRSYGAGEYALVGLAALESGNRELAQEASVKVKNLMALTPRGCSFQDTGSWYTWQFFNGNPERFALALHLFSRLDATDVYNSRVLYELLELQKSYRGYWQSTAATARVLIAISAYIKENKLEETDFTSSVSLDSQKMMDSAFKGVNAPLQTKVWNFGQNDSSETSLLPENIAREKEIPLSITKNGEGTLFYTASLSYTIPVSEQTARDEGLCVYTEVYDSRTGEKVDPAHLKSGEIYREKVYVSSTKARTFVAVRAPIPAGCEILNTSFKTLNALSEKSEKRSYWYSYMSRQELYDAEVRCFWNNLPQGAQSFEFIFRAQRRGTYQTPAITAECMYEPEIFGRSAGFVSQID